MHTCCFKLSRLSPASLREDFVLEYFSYFDLCEEGEHSFLIQGERPV